MTHLYKPNHAFQQGDLVRLTNKVTGESITGTVHPWETPRLLATTLRVQIAGVKDRRNSFSLSDWDVEEVPPEVEEGYYLREGAVVYRVKYDRIVQLGVMEGETAKVPTMGAKYFLRLIKEGHVKRLGSVYFNKV